MVLSQTLSDVRAQTCVYFTIHVLFYNGSLLACNSLQVTFTTNCHMHTITQTVQLTTWRL